MRTHHHQLIVAALLLACGRPAPEPVEMKPEPTLELDGLLGVTVVPGTHERLFLKRSYGVIDAQGKVVMYDPNPYEDLVALDANRIALIMQNDGFVFEMATHKLLSRFCYLPEGDSFMSGTVQQSFGIGWDAVEERLYVQPQTFTDGQRVGGAQLGVFAANQATPLEWQDVGEREMNAGGIAVESRERIWLGWNSTLYLYDAKAKAVQKTFALEGKIDGLALDGDQLLVLDSDHRKLSAVPLSTLR